MELIQNSKGFTLLEVTVGILIASLLLIPAIKLYNITREKNNILDTRGNMISVANAINIFAGDFGRYPRPASLILSENDALFGVEGPVAPPACPDMTVGVCLTATATPTYIGAVPFDLLQIEPINSLDVWSNKLLYAVTASQTNAGTYTMTGGGRIQFTALNSFTGAVIPLTPAINPPNDDYTNFDMILVSTGETGKGGYTADGILVEPCIELGNLENEDENCNFLNDTFMVDRNYRSDPDIPFGPPYTGTMNPNDNGTRNLVPGVNFYDDITYQQEFVPVNFWNENQITNQTIVSTATRIGIGTLNPVNEVHVFGDLTVAGGNQLRTETLCDSVSSNCFTPNHVGGFEPSMNCNAGNTLPGLEPVIGVANEAVNCGAPADTVGTSIIPGSNVFVFPPALIRSPCPPGTLMTGIDASGLRDCVPIP